MFPDISQIIEQLLNFLETVLNEIMRFIEQNIDIIERIVQSINDFLAWLENLIPF